MFSLSFFLSLFVFCVCVAITGTWASKGTRCGGILSYIWSVLNLCALKFQASHLARPNCANSIKITCHRWVVEPVLE